MHCAHESNRRVAVSKGAKYFADGPCGVAQILPHTALVCGDTGQEETSLAKLVEVGSDQAIALLAFSTLVGET